VAIQRTRRTQTADYWLKEFAVKKDDIEQIYEWLLEQNQPRSIDELTIQLISSRCQKEEETLLKRTDQGSIYQPQERFEIGQRVVFPAIDYSAGQVIGVRDGENVRYAPFSVIQVQMDGSDGVIREFAMGFDQDHVLNRHAILAEDAGDRVPAERLHEEYGPHVRDQLVEALAQNDDFVQFGQQWFLRGLVPEVTPFHLNIAEAMIDERGHPLTVSELLKEVGLADSKESIQAYALNSALRRDGRFEETNLSGEPTWYLSALIPEAVRTKPIHLVPMHKAHGGEWLNRELHDFAREIRDEEDDLGLEAPLGGAPGHSVEYILTYPHRREGTIPLNNRGLFMLRERPADRFLVTFIDEQNHQQFRGWMLPGERYAWGLGEWYQQHEIPIGGVVKIQSDDDPFAFHVIFEKGRRRTEWIREAKVINDRLTFSMQRKALVGQCDKYVLLDEGQSSALESLWSGAGTSAPGLFEHITQLFPELAKLSGQGLVHMPRHCILPST